MLGSSTEAEDVTQDVFERVLLALPRFQGETNHLAWIYRIASNACISVLRRRKAAPSFQEAGTFEPPSGERSIEISLASADVLRRAFVASRKKTQLVVTAYLLDEMTQEEIALAYGMTRRTVFAHLTRFRGLVSELEQRR